jgi:DNA-binding NtrC family response regulator
MSPGFAEPEDGLAAVPAAPASRADAVAALVGGPLAEIERAVIEATIARCGGSLPRAARVLGISASTVYRKRAAWDGPPPE